MVQKFKALSSQKLKFALVGVANTVLDFAVLNFLAHALGIPRIPANIVSGSVAMLFSFFVNRSIVFEATHGKAHHQAAKFIAVTVVGVYGLQNIVIFLLSEVFTWPLDVTYSLVDFIEKDIFVTNASKLAATAASLVWNFVLYKKLVFNDEPGKTTKS